MTSPELVILLNEHAGSAAQVEAALDRAPSERPRRLVACDSPDAMRDAIEREVARGASRVAIAGGDGTVSRAARVILALGSPLELAIIPAGTGNDLARSLGVPLEPAGALELALEAEATPIDALEIEGVTPSIAFNAVTARVCREDAGEACDPAPEEPESKEWLGRAAYWVATITELASSEPFRVRVRTATIDTELEAYGLAICNGRTAGGGTIIAPDAKLDDGRLELALFPNQGVGAALLTAFSVATGAEAGDVVRLREERVALECGSPVLISVDGEVSRADRLAARVRPRAIRVVAGPNAALAGA